MIQDKFRAPTKYDLEEYGTVWRISVDDYDDAWIQVSKDKENPTWIRLGPFLVETFNNVIDEEFIAECLELYEEQMAIKNNTTH